MLFQFIWLACGILFLLFAGDTLVRGSVAAAMKAGVSPLIAGIVIVGFGTSLPEMLVSLEAGIAGSPSLAHGNIVGSNIANLLLVLSVPAIIAPISTRSAGLDRSMTATLLATVAWVVITPFLGLNPLIGIISLGLLCLYIAKMVFDNRKEMASGGAISFDEIEEEVGDVHMPVWKMLVFIAIGLIGLFFGAQLTINAGVNIAQQMGVSEAIIGLTLLAVGTSLPEIGAGLAAALRKQGDMALGNVVGSNMFNLLGAGGAVALTGQQALSSGFFSYSHPVMVLATLAVAAFVFLRRDIGRIAGIAFLILYLVFILGLADGWSIPGFAMLSPLIEGRA